VPGEKAKPCDIPCDTPEGAVHRPGEEDSEDTAMSMCSQSSWPRHHLLKSFLYSLFSLSASLLEVFWENPGFRNDTGLSARETPGMGGAEKNSD
jgi:hypothetical protein